MQWTADVSAGDWIRDRLDSEFSASMHGVVPHGFEAYVRIFHPATRDRPVGRPWPGVPYAQHRREWDAFQASQPEIDGERVTWTDTAAAMGTTMHAGAQWNRLVAPGQIALNEDGPRDAAGWRYGAPAVGQLDADTLAAVATLLAGSTTTPDDGFVALWEGWGGVVGAMGWGPSRVLYTFDDGAGQASARHHSMLSRAARDTLNNVFRKPTWQPGALSDEISRGPRLSLPDRDHVLFRGGINELADPGWVLNAPWRDRELEEHGFAPVAESPSLVWPADRAWVLVSEVDFDSTIVAGSPTLVRAIVADPRIEALPVAEGADLTWDGDEVNR